MNKTLVTTALFSALFENYGHDYLDLIMPFAKYIMETEYKINDEITTAEICNHLSEDFYLSNFPRNVAHSILVRLQHKKYIKKVNKKFYLIASFAKERDEFISSRSAVSNSLTTIITKINAYINQELNTKYNILETEKLFENFLSKYGYDVYINKLIYTRIPPNKEDVFYTIGKYIQKCSEEKYSDDFNNIMNLIQGYMLADAVYLQINRKNKSHLRELSVFIDGPLLLRVLKLKSDIENQSTSELIKLMNKFSVKMFIFEHTRDEVIDILTGYSYNLHSLNYNTIEYFNSNNFSKAQVEMYINEIDSKIRRLGIQIVSRPVFDERYMIDEENLTRQLVGHLPNHTNPDSKAVDRDILSVRSINILRKGQNHQSIEDCKYIFLTSYGFLKFAVDSIRKDSNNRIIGPIITDLELTTILWIKDSSVNLELPKLKLMEISLAAIKPSDDVLELTTKFVAELQKEPEFQDEFLDARMSLYYLKEKKYFDQIKNNPKEVTLNLIKSIIEADVRKVRDLDYHVKDISLELEINRKFNFNIIEQNSNKIYSNTIIKGWLIYILVIIIINVPSLIILLNETTNQTLGFLIFSLLSFLIGSIFAFAPKISYAKNIIMRTASKNKQKFLEKKQKEMNKIETEMKEIYNRSNK